MRNAIPVQRWLDGLPTVPERRRQTGGRGAHTARQRVALLLAEIRRQALVRKVQRALLRRLLDAYSATLDEAADLAGLTPDVGQRWRAAAPLMLVRAGLIRSVGYVRSVRPRRHSSPVTLWTLGDREAAESWLAEHVDFPAVTTAKYFLLSHNETGGPGTAAGVSRTL